MSFVGLILNRKSYGRGRNGLVLDSKMAKTNKMEISENSVADAESKKN